MGLKAPIYVLFLYKGTLSLDTGFLWQTTAHSTTDENLQNPEEQILCSCLHIRFGCFGLLLSCIPI